MHACAYIIGMQTLLSACVCVSVYVLRVCVFTLAYIGVCAHALLNEVCGRDQAPSDISLLLLLLLIIKSLFVFPSKTKVKIITGDYKTTKLEQLCTTCMI